LHCQLVQQARQTGQNKWIEVFSVGIVDLAQQRLKNPSRPATLLQCFTSFDRPCCTVLDVEIADFLDDRTNVAAHDDDDDDVRVPGCGDVRVYLRNPTRNKLSGIPTNRAVDCPADAWWLIVRIARVLIARRLIARMLIARI
jgi:hypothetical protein